MNSSKSQFLDNIRKYLTIVSQIDYKLGEPMQKVNSIVVVKKKIFKINTIESVES